MEEYFDTGPSDFDHYSCEGTWAVEGTRLDGEYRLQLQVTAPRIECGLELCVRINGEPGDGDPLGGGLITIESRVDHFPRRHSISWGDCDKYPMIYSRPLYHIVFDGNTWEVWASGGMGTVPSWKSIPRGPEAGKPNKF